MSAISYRNFFAAFLLCMSLMHGHALSEAAATPTPDPRAFSVNGVVWETDSASLRITVENCTIGTSSGYLTTIWMQDPAKQICKASSRFHLELNTAKDLADRLPGAALVINGSGYVSPTYPDIPGNYPGTSENYYYTPLGSVTVTGGTVYRCLPGVPYYGLTLQKDGLHLHNGDDPEEVLALSPIQTWSFYELCPMIMDGRIILDETWAFAGRSAARTIISRLPSGEYQILTMEKLKLTDAVHVLHETYHPDWTYDLDGGPSSALFVRDEESGQMRLLFGARQRIVDVMGFKELEEVNSEKGK